MMWVRWYVLLAVCLMECTGGVFLNLGAVSGCSESQRAAAAAECSGCNKYLQIADLARRPWMLAKNFLFTERETLRERFISLAQGLIRTYPAWMLLSVSLV